MVTNSAAAVWVIICSRGNQMKNNCFLPHFSPPRSKPRFLLSSLYRVSSHSVCSPPQFKLVTCLYCYSAPVTMHIYTVPTLPQFMGTVQGHLCIQGEAHSRLHYDYPGMYSKWRLLQQARKESLLAWRCHTCKWLMSHSWTPPNSLRCVSHGLLSEEANTVSLTKRKGARKWEKASETERI